MKRFLICTLTLAALLALAVPARADIMWEPNSNLFYDTHRDRCEYENRAYYANGGEGFVTLWDAPGGSSVRAQFENGEKLWVYFLYDNSWALTAFWTDGKETSGWVPLGELELVYDYICFREEYAERITEYNNEFADYDGDAEVIYFYPYPGAPEASRSFDVSQFSEHMGDILGNLTGTAENDSYIDSIFVDEDGRTWGYVNYMYGHLNSWFCLDEPDGTDFPVRAVSQPELTAPREPVMPARSYLPYILVAAAAAVTAALLAVFYGRRRKSTH